MKYHWITWKSSGYWQINTSELFSYTRLIQVPGCIITWLADQHRPSFHTRKKCNVALSKFIWLLRACSRGQRLSGHPPKANNFVPFCLSPDHGADMTSKFFSVDVKVHWFLARVFHVDHIIFQKCIIVSPFTWAYSMYKFYFYSVCT